jgi:hypothetical protein
MAKSAAATAEPAEVVEEFVDLSPEALESKRNLEAAGPSIFDKGRIQAVVEEWRKRNPTVSNIADNRGMPVPMPAIVVTDKFVAELEKQIIPIIQDVSFDVVAVRRDPTQARQVVLPFFDVVVRAGDQVVAKRVGYVGLNFAAGSYRAQTSGQAYASVHRGAAALPENVRQILTRVRKPGDPEAAVDPMTDPGVRAAVANATFEHLVGFQLTQEQLRYNVTR